MNRTIKGSKLQWIALSIAFTILTLTIPNFVTAAAVENGPSEPVRPILECVLELEEGGYRAFFGYQNDNPETVEIPIGSNNGYNNRFTPAPQDRGQPTEFILPMVVEGRPGRTGFYPDYAFSVDFDGNDLVWTLGTPEGGTRTSTASSNSKRCPEVCGDGIVQNICDDLLDEKIVTVEEKDYDLYDICMDSPDGVDMEYLEEMYPMEECDDGNTENGDGCDENCKIEETPPEPPLEPTPTPPTDGGGQETPVGQVDDGLQGSGCGSSLLGMPMVANLGYALTLIPLGLFWLLRRKS